MKSYKTLALVYVSRTQNKYRFIINVFIWKDKRKTVSEIRLKRDLMGRRGGEGRGGGEGTN